MPFAPFVEQLILDTPDRPIVGVDPDTIEAAVGPLLDWVLVRLDPPMTHTRGGIAVPDQTRPPARTGTIIEQGPGALSDDGRTRMPMQARPGDRIVFEQSAGRTLPRVPKETTDTRWGYLLVRDGSICSVVRGIAQPDDLDADGPPLPPLGPYARFPATRCGWLSPDRVEMFQDWLLVRTDSRLPAADPTPLARPVKRLTNARGQPIGKRIELVSSGEAQAESSHLWTGTVLKRGPGRVSITRCLDGDRMNKAPKMVHEGDRIMWEAVVVQALPFVDGYAIIQEYVCVPALLHAPRVGRPTPQ